MSYVIEVKNLSVTIKSTKIVDDVSLSVKKGEVFGILGPNGAGKTTTIECIEGIRTNYTGDISVLGFNLLKNRTDLLKKIGIQLQEASYPDRLKVKEICKLYSSFYENPKDFHSLLESIGLHHRVNTHYSKLSGGEKQKLSIILALIPDPEILFLDELTAGLDPRSRREVWDIILKLKKEGITIMTTTHFLEEAEYLCDRICIMNQGKIVYTETMSNIQSLSSKQVVLSSKDEIPQEAFMAIPSVEKVSVEEDVYTIFCQPDIFLKEFNKISSLGKYVITNINVKQATLESIYFEKTGEKNE
ncbi:ABC transporter ATP-binding protein [Vagococcus elongatus]|uniref:ABC transporter domain-containing protein n=1 Tax=Vagococcus elongatus TaxID=180344 RepID=A0A430B5Q6_9ENTE|nr:ABC transporter ATP-binding protein [Vagococcus elongatus]RSU15635.1 hypothetical protein CBF29_00745 [Vagococcus elongatus]